MMIHYKIRHIRPSKLRSACAVWVWPSLFIIIFYISIHWFFKRTRTTSNVHAELFFICSLIQQGPFYTSSYDYGFTLAVCVAVRPSVCRTPARPYFLLRVITWVNINGFSPQLVWALILWRSNFGLLTGKFCRIWQICPRHARIFVSGDNLSMDFHEACHVHWYCGDL